MSKSLAYPGLLALGLAATLAAQKPVEATVKVADLSNRDAMPPVVPLSESATLSKVAPKGAPTGIHDGWYGTIRLADRDIQIAVAKSDAALELPDLICIDLNADGSFDKTEQMPIEVTTQESRGTTIVRSTPIDAEFAFGDEPIAVKVAFMKAGDRDPGVSLQFPNYLAATVDIADSQRVVAVLDKDYDGTYGTDGDLWALADDSGRPANAYALSAMNERRFLDGQLIGIKVEGMTITATVEAATGPDPADAAAHRLRVEHIWMERFDEERDGFVSARSLDTTRAIATKPIPWKYVTFEEAIALGKAAKKPVFIDVMAFWCVWCYRMDYYTYPDADVAKILTEDYIPVKIIQEQDAAGDYATMMEKLEARGIPAMGIFNADGDVLHKISGWKKPEDFLQDLATGKKNYDG